MGLAALALVAGGQVLSRGKAWNGRPVAGAILVVLLIASLVTCIQLVLGISPPVTHDERPVMPLGQIVAGSALGVAFWGGLSWLYFKRFRPESRVESIWLYATIAALAAATVIDANV